MSLKIKVLGLGLLAVLATSAFAAVNVSAETSGHFTSEATEHHLIVKATEEYDPNDATKKHHLTFQRTNSKNEPVGDPIKCTHAAYHGTLTGSLATTAQEVALTPEYKDCATRSSSTWGEVTVHHEKTKECETGVYRFTSGNPGTVHVECPITVTHPSCTIRIPKQTLTGVTYTTDLTTGVHSLTAHVNVQNITGHFEAGICVFLGTTHKFHMEGSVTVWATDTETKKVGITHTIP